MPVGFLSVEGLVMKKVVLRHEVDRCRLDSRGWNLFLCMCTYTASVIEFAERNSLYLREAILSHWNDSYHHVALLQGSLFQYFCMSWGLTGRLRALHRSPQWKREKVITAWASLSCGAMDMTFESSCLVEFPLFCLYTPSCGSSQLVWHPFPTAGL